VGFTGMRAPSESTPLIQQIHIVEAHAICGQIEQELFGPPDPDALPSGTSRGRGALYRRFLAPCGNLAPVPERWRKARKIVLAFPASYAKLLVRLAKTTVLSQRIFNGVG